MAGLVPAIHVVVSPPSMRVLILGGSTEAAALARALAADTRFAPVLSLAGRTRAPAPAGVPQRVGGFGGVDGLAAALHSFDALIDATHPFAAGMQANAAAAAAQAGTPRLGIARPAWSQHPGDRWTIVPTIEAAAEALGPLPRRVFLTVGQQSLLPFRAAPWHRYLVRTVDPPDPALLPPGTRTIAARGPFAAEDEVHLLSTERVEVVVTKNSGGAATEGKLLAARRLGLPVVMVSRPPPRAEPTVPDVAGALAWLHAALRGV